MGLSKAALELLTKMFSDQSNIQLPIGYAPYVVEIREWLKEMHSEKNNA